MSKNQNTKLAQQAQHSPLPWSYSGVGGDNLIMMRPMFGSDRVAVAEVLFDEAQERISIEEMDANKVFIVQAVNHAEALAEALRITAGVLRHCNGQFEATKEIIADALAAWEAAQ